MGEGGSGAAVFDFLGMQVVGVTTLLAAVDSTGWQVSKPSIIWKHLYFWASRL